MLSPLFVTPHHPVLQVSLIIHIIKIMFIIISGSCQPQSTSVPGDRENNNCTCSECSNSAVIAVSAVSLLLIVILTTVILTQCVLMIRMRKSKDRKETYAEVMTSTTMHMDVPVTPKEAYALHKITSSTNEVTYELIK